MDVPTFLFGAENCEDARYYAEEATAAERQIPWSMGSAALNTLAYTWIQSLSVEQHTIYEAITKVAEKTLIGAAAVSVTFLACSSLKTMWCSIKEAGVMGIIGRGR